MPTTAPGLRPWAANNGDPGGGNTPSKDSQTDWQSRNIIPLQPHEIARHTYSEAKLYGCIENIRALDVHQAKQVNENGEEDSLVACDDDHASSFLDQEDEERDQEAVTSCLLTFDVGHQSELQSESEHAPQNTSWRNWFSIFRTKLGVDMVVKMEEGMENDGRREYQYKHKEHDEESGDASTASSNYDVISEKAVSTRTRDEGYGIYPHFADPPLQNTQYSVPKYPTQHRITYNQKAHTPRPGRRSENPHQRIQLYTVHILSAFGQSLLIFLSQSIQAIANIFLRSLDYFGVSRFVGKLFFWQSNSDMSSKHIKLKAKKRRKQKSTPIFKMDNENEFMADIDPTSPWLNQFIAGRDGPLFGASDELLDAHDGPPQFDNGNYTILATIAMHNSELLDAHDGPPQIDNGNYTILPTNTMHIPQLVNPPQYIPDHTNLFAESAFIASEQLPDNDSKLNHSCTPMQFHNELSAHERDLMRQFTTLSLPPSPAPAGIESPGVFSPEDMTPAFMSDTTSADVSPLTEGLRTPTFTLSVHSPVSVRSPQQSSKYICPEESCGHKEFDRPCDRNKHLKTHEKTFQCEYSSQGCPARFATKKDLKRHLASSKHSRERKFICKFCKDLGLEGTFTRKDNLKDHQKRVHKDIVHRS